MVTLRAHIPLRRGATVKPLITGGSVRQSELCLPAEYDEVSLWRPDDM